MRRAHEEALRQGEIASKGKWIGDPLGGVKAPPALILPDLTTRFANTAARLEALSAKHPMVAPSYSAQRSVMAKEFGLGRDRAVSDERSASTAAASEAEPRRRGRLRTPSTPQPE